MTEKQTHRQKKILELMGAENRINVALLADMLGVSKVTLRKDIDQLEEKGIIRHEKGQVFTGSSDEINSRLSYHYDTKLKIARRACALVADGETVMIESGSCCTILAEELILNKREARIITNSAFIAGYIRRLPQAKIVLLGGDYQNAAQVMVGPITRLCAQSFMVDKLFIGTDGVCQAWGFSGKDHMRAETVRDMAKQADKVIVLTESEKFSQTGLTPLLPFNGIHTVITDEAVPAEAERLLLDRGVQVCKVPLG